MKLDKLLNSNNIEIKSNIYSILPDFSHPTEKRVLNKATEGIEIEYKDSKKSKSFSKYMKLQDSYLECLKRYLEEDKYITTKKALKRLREEAGLDVSIRLVHRSLIKLREEMGPEYLNLDKPVVKIKKSKDRSKLKDMLTDHITKYIEEDRLIGPTEARKRLLIEAGLKMSFSSVRKALLILRKKTNQESSDLSSPSSEPKVRNRKRDISYKLKDPHMEQLKNYLKEDSFIGATKARNRLKDETGLVVSIQTIKKILLRLKKEIEPEYTSLDSSTVKNIQSSNRYKLKGVHLEYLKKCLMEHNSIGATKARDLLREETGLEVSVCPVQQALIRLRKEINQERNGLSALQPEAKIKDQEFGYKLKDSHIERLKRYLNENRLISTAKAIRRLQEETGLKVSIPTVHKTLIRLRKEMNPENSNLSSSTTEYLQPRGRIILNDSHKEYLKGYLKEDKYIISKDAMKRLREETGLKVSCVTVYRALVKLRQELGPEYVKLDLSVVRSKYSGDRIKIKDSYLDRLKQYLKEDKYLMAVDATKRLCEETGLKVSVPTVHKALLKLKKEVNLDLEKLCSATVINRRSINRFKLKDTHLALVKKYLKEDRRIGPTKTKNRLREETGLEMSIPTARNALIKLRK